MDTAAIATGGFGVTLDPSLKRESWAVVAVPRTTAPPLSTRAREEARPWGILWKKRSYSEFRWMNKTCTSEDHAMTTIVTALSASPLFVQRHAAGDFYCIPLRYCISVPYLPGAAVNSELQNLLIEFGLSTSLEVAVALVEGALLHGTAWPPKTAAWWRGKLNGSLVVPVPVHRRVVVEEVPNVAG